jgi:hypothetical protein
MNSATTPNDRRSPAGPLAPEYKQDAPIGAGCRVSLGGGDLLMAKYDTPTLAASVALILLLKWNLALFGGAVWVGPSQPRFCADRVAKQPREQPRVN